MSENLPLKNYQEKKKLVLDLVRQEPLFSVDRPAEKLPEVSRRSIQRILEKNNLSTAEKRLTYSSQKKAGFSFSIPKLGNPFRGINLGKSKEVIDSAFQKSQKPKLKLALVKTLVVLGAIGFGLWQGINFASLKPPEISLQQPELDAFNKGEKLFVVGKVFPANSQVTIAGQEVSLNGDGTFTAVTTIPMGESTLKVEASKWGKKSKVVRLVNRIPTEEEEAFKAAKEAEEKRKASDKVAELERTVNDLLAAKNATGDLKGLLRVLNNHIKEEEDFYSVAGEVVNLGEKEASWVMITARFFDEQGEVIDTKYGFATDFGQILKPDQKSKFETQATTKDFDHYSLELSWEEGTVAGEATESAQTPTPSEEPSNNELNLREQAP